MDFEIPNITELGHYSLKRSLLAINKEINKELINGKKNVAIQVSVLIANSSECLKLLSDYRAEGYEATIEWRLPSECSGFRYPHIVIKRS